MKKKKKMRSFASRLTGWIMLMMLLTMGITSYLIYEAAYSIVKEEEFSTHEGFLSSKVAEIRHIISDVYVGTVNHVPEIEAHLNDPDHLIDIMERVVALNPYIHRCGLSFVDSYYPQKGRWFCPYAVRRDSSHIETRYVGSADYDYLKFKWFEEALKSDKGMWSKPFFENNDSVSPLVSYLYPIHDRQGRTVAILGADLSLDWLHKKMVASDYKIMMKEWMTLDSAKYDLNQSDMSSFKPTYSFIVAGDGTYLVHPQQQRAVRKNIFDYIKQDPDTLSTYVVHQMMAGKHGYLGYEFANDWSIQEIEDAPDSDGGRMVFEGRKSYLFYAPIKYTDWSMGLSVPVYTIDLISGVVGFVLLFLIGVGLLVVYLVSHFTIRRIAKPLKQLANSAHEVAKGHFTTPLPDIKHNDEIHMLRDSFEDMQHSLADYVEELKTTTASKAAIESELEVAHNIQMGMLPKIFPPYPDRSDVDIFGSLTPAKEVGGDLFDFFIRNDLLFFCIGDVSGKGVPASLVMAVTRTLFRNITAHMLKPDRIITTLNDTLSDGNDTCMFVTLFLGVLDLSDGTLRYCNAGHDEPMLIGDDVSMLPCDSNVPLGVVPGWTFSGQTTHIEPQTTIFLYTDGLTEAEDVSHAQFGIDRVEAVARKISSGEHRSPKDIVGGMTDAVKAFVREADPSDDLTMLAVKYMKTNGQK